MSKEFREFGELKVAPHAAQWDREEALDPGLIEELGQRKYLALGIPSEFGGQGGSYTELGMLHQEIGRHCSSTRSLLTVQSMVAAAILRWGSRSQRDRWLPDLASGRSLAGFALTEPGAGSDAKGIQAQAQRSGDDFILNGAKKWVTVGQLAKVFLVFAQSEKGPIALLVERDSPGLTVTAMGGLLGVRASMLACLEFQNCRIPSHSLVGGHGFGLAGVAYSALEVGRYSVAWGCTGILDACRQACLRYADQREQFGSPLREHQLVAGMLTNMVVDYRASRALCREAGEALDASEDLTQTKKVLAAKYFASRAATRAALDAVQIHGANGCGPEYPVGRYLRDAKTMELVEGSNQMQKLMIAQLEYQNLDL